MARIMRYSKLALLIFGLGLVLGLAVVAAEWWNYARIPSLLMALGIAAIPVAIFFDWRRAAPFSRLMGRFRRRKPTRRRSPPKRRRARTPPPARKSRR